MLGTLYIVATPIGNLEDVTLRAIRVLSEVDIILAEDTRVTQKLIAFVNEQWLIFNGQKGISNIINQPSTINHSKPLVLSYHQHSGEQKKLEILKYLMDGKNVALVTDAGTPGVSDPGNELIDYLYSYQPELKILSVPGASAITAALSLCGFNSGKFMFIGFIPKKKSKKLLEESLKTGYPVVFFESPYRINKTILLLKSLNLPPKRVFVGQELTKLHERGLRGSVDSVLKALDAEEKELGRVKGEIVVILEP